MPNTTPNRRSERQDKRLRFSIRKFNVGVASVAVAAFFMVNGSSVSADSIETTVVDVVETVEASEESLAVSDEEPDLVQEIVETAVEEIPEVEETVDDPSQALEEVREEAEEISTTELEVTEETGVATEKQETVETDKVVEEENTKSELAPLVQERSAQVVETRVASTSYRVRYVDEETGQVVYQRNYTASQETSATQEVANDFKVTVALELETATALSGYSLSETQEVTIRDNAIEAIVSERNNRQLLVNVRKDDVSASDGEASDGFSALRAEEEKTETEQKAEEVNKELKETAELISGRNSNLTISTRYEQAMYLESMDQYLADQKARMEQVEIQATAERNRYAANEKIVQAANTEIKAKAQEVNKHELITVRQGNSVAKTNSQVSSFKQEEINKLDKALEEAEAKLTKYNEDLKTYNAQVKAQNDRLKAGQGVSLQVISRGKKDEDHGIYNGYSLKSKVIVDDYNNKTKGVFQSGQWDITLNTETSYNEKTGQATITIKSVTVNKLDYETHRPTTAYKKEHFFIWKSPDGTEQARRQSIGDDVEKYSVPFNKTYTLNHSVTLKPGETSSDILIGINSPEWEESDPSRVYVKVQYNPTIKKLTAPTKPSATTVTYRTATLDDKVEQYTLRYNTVSAKEPEKTGDVIVRYIPVDEYGVQIGRRVMNQRITGNDGGTYDVSTYHRDTIELDGVTYQRVDIDGTNPQPYTSDAPEQGVFINGEDQVVRYYYEPVIKRRGSVYALYQDMSGKELKSAELVLEDVVRTSYDTSTHRPETLEVDGETYYLVTVDSLMTDGTSISEGVKMVEEVVGEGEDTITETAATSGEVVHGTTRVTYVYDRASTETSEIPVYGDVVIHYVDKTGRTIMFDEVDTYQAEVARYNRTLVTDPNGNVVSDTTELIPSGVTYNTTEGDEQPRAISFNGVTYYLVTSDDVMSDGTAIRQGIKQVEKEEGDYGTDEYEKQTAQTSGEVVQGSTHITYVYQEGGNVLVRYYALDENGGVISPLSGTVSDLGFRGWINSEEFDTSYGQPGSVYDTSDLKPKMITDINGDTWYLVENHSQDKGDAETGEVETNTTKVINYYYKKATTEVTKTPVYGDVVIHYVDKDGNTIKADEQDTLNAVVGELVRTLVTDPNSKVISDETVLESTGYTYDTTEADEKPETIVTEDGLIYRLVDVEGQEQGYVVEGTTHVTYVYEIATGDIIVHYFAVEEDGTIAPLSGEVLDLVDKTVVNVSEPATSLVEAGTLYDTTSLKPEIIYATNGEVWYLVNDLTEGEETGQVEAGITKTVNYFYKKATPVEEVTDVLGQVVIHYVDKAGNPIRDDYYDSQDVVAYTMYRYYEVTPNGDVINSSFTSGTNPEATYDTTEGDEKPEIIVTEAGLTYRLVDVEGEEQGYVGEGVTHVTYIYDLAVGSVAVHYHIVDKDGTLLLENAWSPRSVEQAVGDSYSTLDLRADELSFIGKSFRLMPERTDGVSETGTVTEGTQIINYYYTEVLPEPQIIEVIKEVEVEKIVEVTKEVPVEVIREIPVEVIREVEVEKIVEVIQEIPVEVIKEIPVEVIREIEVEKIVEVIQEVPVEVIKEIPVEIIREIEVEKIVEVIQEVPVEVIREIPVEVIREIEVEKIVEVIQEVPVEVIKEIPVEVIREIEVEKIVEVIKEVEVDQPRPTVTTIYRQVANGVEEVEVTELGGQTSERVLTTYTNSKTTERLPYTSQRQEDANLASGLEEVRQAGRDGQVVSGITYTVENGRLVTTPVVEVIQPVPEIIAFGTKVTEVISEQSQSLPEQEETPVGEDYRGELVAKKEDLQDRLAGIDAEISLAEDLLREEAVYGQVLSENLTHLQGDLVSVQDKLTQVNADLASLRSDLAGVDSKIASREAELEELKANSSHAQLLTEISQIEASIKTKNDRIADINSLLPQKRAELEALRDEAGLDARIEQQQAVYDKLVAEQEAAQKAVNDKKASREAKRQTQQAAIDQMKAKLLTLGEKVTTVTNEDIFLDVPVESYRKKSQDAWERNVRDNAKNTVKQELVRFTGDRDEVVELTAAQAKEYQETGKFTYVPNEAQVEKFFYQYLKEIRQNNGIAIPLEESAEATDYSRRRARENAALNGGAGKLTHDTNQPDKQTAGYENAGLLVLGERFKSDQEVAYYLAFNWFSDYTNVGKNQAVNGGYGHRNNLLLGSHMADKTTGAVQRLATDHGNGLGFHQSSAVDTSYDYNLKYQEKWWHYLQNGYRYTWEAGLSPIAISRDAQNNQYLEINGKKTPTVFMDALTFKYVIKGQTETFVNQAYVNLEKQIEQAERALRLSLEHCDEELARLEAQVPDLTAAAQALADLKETKKQLPAKRQQLEADIKALETERSQHEADLANLTQLLATKTAELNDDTSLLRQRELEKELAELRSQRQELQEAIATKERERDDLIVQEQDLTQDIARLEEEILAHNQGVADFESLLSITRLKHAEIEDYIVVVDDLIDDLDNYDQRNRLGDLEEAQVLIAPTPEDKPQPVERPEATVEEEVPAEEEISAIPDYAPEAEALPEYVFNPDDFKDVLPAEEEKPVEQEPVEENPVEEPVVETQLAQPKPLPRPEQPAQATGGVAAASTIQPVSHHPQAPLAQETGQETLPATGETVSLVALLGAGMTTTGLVGLKRRRR